MLIIETPRLRIRVPEINDIKPLNDAINRSLPELQQWEPWSFDPSLEATELFIQKAIGSWNNCCQQDFPLVVELKSSGSFIGVSGYNDQSDPHVPYFEIGYWLETTYVGNGYATEISNVLTRYAFEHLGAVRVQIKAQVENTKSIAVAKRCHYSQEAIIKKIRLDCQTQKPCDEIVLACFDTSNLPKLTYQLL